MKTLQIQKEGEKHYTWVGLTLEMTVFSFDLIDASNLLIQGPGYVL